MHVNTDTLMDLGIQVWTDVCFVFICILISEYFRCTVDSRVYMCLSLYVHYPDDKYVRGIHTRIKASAANLLNVIPFLR